MNAIFKQILSLAAFWLIVGCTLVPVTPPTSKYKMTHQRYDGVANDLLTGGLGASGLAKSLSPSYGDPQNPTAAELRTRAIHTNYRALVDTTPGGGYGTLYGPSVDLNGQPSLGEGMVAGDEYLAYSADGANVTMMVQVPANFDRDNPCIVSATSSGSRGVYGAIATVGEWALKRRCAVAYTDKGTGTGAHDITNDTVNIMTGERRPSAVAGDDSNFTVNLNSRQLASYREKFPYRFAFKHAHSQGNPEKNWGRYTLDAIEFAFHVLNQLDDNRKGRYVSDNTLVIAASVSNGGYASLMAAEQDKKRLIDAVVVAEPNASLPQRVKFSIKQGASALFTAHSRPLLDYATLTSIYQPCASTAIANSAAPFNTVPTALGAARCDALATLGLLKSKTVVEQAAEAQQILNDYGILPESNLVHPSHYTFYVPQSIAVTYANAYGRFNVEDNLCGYSFGATVPVAKEGKPADFGKPTPAVNVETIFTTSSGIPPTAGINLINNLSPDGPKEDRLSSSASTGKQDMNLDGALCLRALAIGVDPVTGGPLSGQELELHRRIQQGIRETQMSGDLHGLPTIIVTGRADAVLAPNHASRAYVGLNQLAEGSKGGVRYYEVTNAQHLDAFNAFPGFDARYVPLHHYYIQSLNMMWSNLKAGKPLAPSQVVRTSPRGVADGKAPPIGSANLPAIQMNPAQDARIIFESGVLKIPD